MLERSLAEMANRISELHSNLPDTWAMGDDEEIDHICYDILAIEAEWITNDEQRADMSCIQPDDDA